jgi:outer membrane protein assembly factor BamB
MTERVRKKCVFEVDEVNSPHYQRIDSSPVVAYDTVYFGGPNHYLYALNPKDGSVR